MHAHRPSRQRKHSLRVLDCIPHPLRHSRRRAALSQASVRTVAVADCDSFDTGEDREVESPVFVEGVQNGAAEQDPEACQVAADGDVGRDRGAGEVAREGGGFDLHVVAVRADVEGREGGEALQDEPVCEAGLGEWAWAFLFLSCGRGCWWHEAILSSWWRGEPSSSGDIPDERVEEVSERHFIGEKFAGSQR